MSYPVTHPSDVWLDRRWAITRAPHPQGVVEAHPFRSEKARDAWVSESRHRQAVGKRHPAVKALRQAWAISTRNART